VTRINVGNQLGNPMKQAEKVLNTALNGLDLIGYRLDQFGITDKVNRHNALAFLFAEQQRLKGELDSLNVKVMARKVQLERVRNQLEQQARSGVNSLLEPLKSTLSRLQAQRS